MTWYNSLPPNQYDPPRSCPRCDHPTYGEGSTGDNRATCAKCLYAWTYTVAPDAPARCPMCRNNWLVLPSTQDSHRWFCRTHWHFGFNRDAIAWCDVCDCQATYGHIYYAHGD